MPWHIRAIQILLVAISLPVAFSTFFAGGMVVSLIWEEMFPDPDNIAHGMGMLGLVPFIVYALAGLVILSSLRFLWFVIKRRAQQPQ